MKKIVSFLLVLSCIGAVVSCKKETITSQNEQSSASVASASDAVTGTTKFGALINGEEGEDKIKVCNEMGVVYVRDAIILESYNGKAPMMDKYQQEGFKVLLNLNNKHVSAGGAKKANAYPTDMIKYKKSLESILDKYKPEMVVIENEPANEGRYTGPIENYFTQLRTAIDVCKARGLKISDGGLHTSMVCILVYQDYINRGMQKQADDFGKRALNSQHLRAAQGKGSSDVNAKLEKCKKMIAAYKNMALDYVNIHWYEPMGESNNPNLAAQGVCKEVADYLKNATGKNVLTNEFGQDNQSTSLITGMVSEFRKANLSYAIVFSGTGVSGAQPLHKGTKLLPNGIAYRDAIAE
jgi:hypothetical protein